ncbi:MAG: carbohydrate ABC transporter permease [Synergistaceae bacterium]|jgi:sn-glycerol 3-phosphate transport system permease protein|nr:carbohydrate ABC transporter permease [Synergistaceae bacterium]
MSPDARREFFLHIVLISVLSVLLFPLAFALSNSFKTLSDAYSSVGELIPSRPTLENYIHVFSRLDIARITFNTLFIAVIAAVFKVATSVLSAYAFTAYEFEGKNALYFVIISTMFIPFNVTMLPNYLTISSLGLDDALIGVALPQLADATGIFLIRQSMKTIPKSIIEAAAMENKSRFGILRDIVIPLTRPAIMSVGIIFFINSWNEYVWPVLMLKSRSNFTLSLALQMYISSEGGTEFTVAMAVSVLTMLVPLTLYLIFQKFIISTFTSSGVKE